MKQVVIVVPMYKERLHAKDEIALRQLQRVLGRYPRVFAMPMSLTPHYGALGRGVRIERFPDAYFRGTLGYSSLLLSDEFYARFANYEYVLIYQTDAFVFHDALAAFCAMGYDYIGAPIGRMEAAWHVLGMQVGNGGFSLRRVAACRRVLATWRAEWEDHPFRDFFLRYEDMFFSYCGTRKDLAFRVPDTQTALAFSVQGNVRHAYQRMQQGWRPFGCHGWDKVRFDVLTQAVATASGIPIPRATEAQREEFRTLFRATHRFRSGVNLMPLFGLVRRGKFLALRTRLQAELARYPDGDPAWAGKAGFFGLLWRCIHLAGTGMPAEGVLRSLEEAMARSCSAGTMSADETEELFSLLPQLPENTVTACLRAGICAQKWAGWDAAARYAAPYEGPRTKRILVAAACENDADVVESFVRHTLSFADGILVNVHGSYDGSRRILQRLQAEGCPVDWLDAEMTPTAFCASVRRASDASFILSLSVRAFLLPEPGRTVRGTLETLDEWRDCAVPARPYAPLHAACFHERFLLARALVRGERLAPRTVIYGRGSEGAAPLRAPLELAVFPRDACLETMEPVDIAPLVERQENRYTVPAEHAKARG